MLLVDDLPAPGDAQPVLKWRGYSEEQNESSVPRYVDEHGDALRARYLAFVHDLGETNVGGRPLHEHFETSDGFSLWWMNRVPEKSPFKSPRIFDCLRLLALEEILVDRRIAALTLYSTDEALTMAVAGLCGALDIRFHRIGGSKKRAGMSFRRMYDALPHVVRGLLSFRHTVLNRRLRRVRPVNWFVGDDALFACSYFYNLDPASTGAGRFRSRQWERLPDRLRATGAKMNWLHHYLPDTMGVDAGVSLLRTFNRNDAKQEQHAFLESYLSVGVVWRAFKLWTRMIAAGSRLPDLTDAFRPRGSTASLWPLLADDWRNSIAGTAAVSNCIWIALFDTALAEVPAQRRGVYLYEGQGWEAAFLHAWRKHGHGEIIAVPHSSTPFWYLNLYDDQRCVVRESSCRKPMPDRWALNGPAAWNAFANAGYPAERLVRVEALRYQYLLSTASNRATSRLTSAQPLRLLVLGDFTREQTLAMLSRLERVSASMPDDLEVTIKLHPLCRVERRDVGELRCEFTAKELNEILGDFDAAFVSNTTSAGLDALLSGIPVVVFLDDAVMNHSPLRGVDGVVFASSAAELGAALMDTAGRRPGTRPGDFFWLDPNLPRWKALLLPQTELMNDE